MKTLVLDGAIFSMQRSGGISRFWATLLEGLDHSVALKNKVILLLPKNENLEWDKVQKELRHIQIVPRRRFYSSRRGFFRGRGYLTYLAAKYRPDVWHSSYYVGFPKAFCKKRIISFYDMIPEVLGTALLKETVQKKASLTQATCIASISKSTERDLGRFWPTLQTKSVVIPLCATVERVSQRASKPYFLFLGGRKGYKNFIEPAKHLLADEAFSEYTLRAVGGDKELSIEEEKLLQVHGSRLSLEEAVDFNKLHKLLTEASAVIYPSLYEGFGLPVLEAFAASVPVLASRSSSIPEITGEKYPLADPKDPKSYLITLKTLLDHREKWVAYGHKRVEMFSKTKMTDRFIQLYAL